jgi:hypothetical protein
VTILSFASLPVVSPLLSAIPACAAEARLLSRCPRQIYSIFPMVWSIEGLQDSISFLLHSSNDLPSILRP